MPIREMLRYAASREKGSGTEAERRALLERHREQVRARVAELEACLLVLDTKIAGYADIEKRIEDHDAHQLTRRNQQAGARQAGPR